MSEFPFGYKIIPIISWTYLSSLLMIALYFKFNRFWSVRNLDLLMIILLAPGLLMVSAGAKLENRFNAEQARQVAKLVDGATEDSETIDSGGTGIDRSSPDTVNEANNGNAEEPPVEANDDSEQESKSMPITEKLERARSLQRNGFVCLFLIAGLFAIRMLVDPMMVRRPMLDPNLSIGGLTFLGSSLLLFLILNVIGSKPTTEDLYGLRSARNMHERTAMNKTISEQQKHGPGYGLVFILPTVATFVADQNGTGPDDVSQELQGRKYVITAKIMAIVCQLALVAGIFYIGYVHFGNARMGVGIATLYLMLPYTAEMTGRVVHILPAALLIWAIAFYRRPWVAGTFVGLAMGVFYYPLFLLPLWLSFYWKRGRWRFLGGISAMLVTLAISLLFVSEDLQAYLQNLSGMFGVWTPRMEGLQGIWGLGWDSVYRLPVLAGFFVLSIAFAMWPAQKNLGTLICCSCALMAVVQFWHGYGGGLLMGWYLPLGLLAIFRPNLDDRVALSVLKPRRRSKNAADLRPAA